MESWRRDPGHQHDLAGHGGVKHHGVNHSVWSDHTDVRPTVLARAGLHDDYRHDGRVLFEDLEGYAIPPTLRESNGLTKQLADVYKQINAPVGQLGLASLLASTRALKSDDPNDATYTSL